MKTYACVYLGSTFLGLLTTPVVARLARRVGLVDPCGARKVHTSPIPRIGGLAIVVVMLTMAFAAFAVDNVIGEAFRSVGTKVIVLLAGAVFIAIVGLIDDVRGLSARVKLASEVLAALVVCAFGIRIESLTVGGWFTVEFGWATWAITVFWIVGITNAVNLIDGLDGLAAGISAAACGVIAILSFYTNQPVMAVLMLALLGSLTGFLRFNFYPARIFMGDCGSLFLGFVLAASSVLCAMKSAAIVGLALPALALGIPIFDTLFSIVRRILRRQSIYAPDRSHIHHRLLDLGLRQRHAVITMYLVTVVAAGMGMFMIVLRDVGSLVVLGSVLVLLMLVFHIAGAVRLRESFNELRAYFAVSREAKKEKRSCESAEIHLSRAGTLDNWWKAICVAAEQMDFSHLSVSVSESDGAPRTLVWSAEGGGHLHPGGTVRLERTVQHASGGPRLHIEAEMPVDGSLESAGRRLALLGRLIDQHDVARLLPVSMVA